MQGIPRGSRPFPRPKKPRAEIDLGELTGPFGCPDGAGTLALSTALPWERFPLVTRLGKKPSLALVSRQRGDGAGGDDRAPCMWCPNTRRYVLPPGTISPMDPLCHGKLHLGAYFPGCFIPNNQISPKGLLQIGAEKWGLAAKNATAFTSQLLDADLMVRNDG